MKTFEDLSLTKQLFNAVSDLHFNAPTPIQVEAYPVISSGRNVVGIAQTGTGKTLAYLLPLLKELEYSKEIPPRILILVPTRELVIQIVEQVELLTKYMSTRVIGVYGGANINTQKAHVVKGCDVLVATPGRLYDIAMHGALKLKAIKKLVIDEVDVLYLLRMQRERMNEALVPSLREYTTRFGLTAERAERLGDHTLVMHPGPMNRGVEITVDPSELRGAVITQQVANGIAVRMAVLFDLLGAGQGSADTLKGSNE